MVGQLNACEMVGRHDGKGVVRVLLLAMKLGGGAGALLPHNAFSHILECVYPQLWNVAKNWCTTHHR